MSEGQKNWGITVLVWEIKRIGNVAKWFFLLQGIKYVAWRTLENADLSISSVCSVHFYITRSVQYIFAGNIVSSSKISLTEG